MSSCVACLSIVNQTRFLVRQLLLRHPSVDAAAYTTVISAFAKRTDAQKNGLEKKPAGLEAKM